jgi:hypothetical protein
VLSSSELLAFIDPILTDVSRAHKIEALRLNVDDTNQSLGLFFDFVLLFAKKRSSGVWIEPVQRTDGTIIVQAHLDSTEHAARRPGILAGGSAALAGRHCVGNPAIRNHALSC